MNTTESNRAGAGNYKKRKRMGSKATNRKEDDLYTMKHVVYQGEAMSIAH